MMWLTIRGRDAVPGCLWGPSGFQTTMPGRTPPGHFPPSSMVVCGEAEHLDLLCYQPIAVGALACEAAMYAALSRSQNRSPEVTGSCRAWNRAIIRLWQGNPSSRLVSNLGPLDLWTVNIVGEYYSPIWALSNQSASAAGYYLTCPRYPLGLLSLRTVGCCSYCLSPTPVRMQTKLHELRFSSSV